MTRHLDKLRLRLRSLFRTGRADGDLARELRGHIDEETAANVAAGMTPRQARHAAARAFGAIGPIEERCRDTRRITRISNFFRDVRYGMRAFGRQPGLFAAAVASIALGLGATLTMVSLANSLLLAPPSADRADELVMIRMDNGSHVSHQGWKHLNDSGVLAGIAGSRFEDSVNWRVGERSAMAMPMLVTANFFDVVRVPIHLGRGFTTAEAEAERAPRLVVISSGFWEQRLDRDPAVVGRSMIVNGQAYTITGVLSAGVRSVAGFGISPDLYLPISRELFPAIDHPRAGAAQLIGRLRPGQTVAEARAGLSTVVTRIANASPSPEFESVREFASVGGLTQAGEIRGVAVFFAVLVVVSGLVLIIACANVAGLLLARGLARRREMALRTALGASRGRLIQQLLAETLYLTAAGAIAGATLTAGTFQALSRVTLPIPIPVALQFSMDWRMAAIAAGLLSFSVFASGLAPAFHTTKGALLPSIKADERRFSVRRLTVRAILVAGQVAVSLVLLVAALLFVQSARRAAAISPGFDVDPVLVAQLSFVEGRQGSPQRQAVEDIVERVRALPGVTAAAFSGGVPLTAISGSRTGTDARIDGRPDLTRVEFDGNRVGPDYFKTMGIRMVLGRDFTSADRGDAPGVVVVNEEFARRYLPGENPIGRRIVGLGRPGASVEIIGVVSNGKYRSLSEAGDAAVYSPALAATPGRLIHLLVRTARSPDASAAAVRTAVLAADGSTAVTLMPMRSAVAFAELPSRMGSAFLGVLGALGTILAMVGLFGVISFAVSRRTKEIAVRMALGASRRSVLTLVLKGAGGLVISGLCIGLIVAWLITGPLASFLVSGVSPTDPWSFGGAAALLLVGSLAAVWGPATKAIRIAPAVALKID